MDQNVLNSVMLHASKGRKILLGHSHNGHVKVKIKRGLFGLIVNRYALDHETYDEIKKRLKINSRLM